MNKLSNSKWSILLSPLYILIIPLILIIFYFIALATEFFLMLVAIWLLAGLLGSIFYALLYIFHVNKEKRIKFYLIVTAIIFVILTSIHLYTVHKDGGILSHLGFRVNQSKVEIEGP